VDSKEIYQNSFFSVESLEIINNQELTKIENTSGSKSFKDKKEMILDKNIKEIENINIDLLIEKIQEDNIIIQIEQFDFISPEIKIFDKNFEISKLKIESNDLTSLTDHLVDEKVIINFYYNDKKLNIYESGFLFKKYIKKNLISKTIATYNCEEELPNLENRINIKL
jgi:hypothetical protein